MIPHTPVATLLHQGETVYTTSYIMIGKNTKFYSLLLIFVDFITLVAAFSTAYLLRVSLDDRNLITIRDDSNFLIATLCIVPVWLFVLAILGAYHSAVYNRRLVEWSKLLIGSFVGVLLVIGWEYITNERIFPARLVTVYVLIGSFFLLCIGRELLRSLRSYLFTKNRGTNRLLIVGNSDATYDIARSLADTKKSGFNVVAVAGPNRVIPSGLSIARYRDFTGAEKDLEKLGITTIIQTDLFDSAERNQQILNAALSRHIAYSFIPGEPEFYSGKNTVDVFLGYPIISVSQTPLIGWGAIAKRVFDLVIATILLIILSPLLLLLILLQQLFNPGPVFFKHERLTMYSKPFKIFKFRSMKHEYSSLTPVEAFKKMKRDDLVEEFKEHFKVEEDPRITTFGRFIRKTSLDELPQLLNVIKGDLSLVGPRPVPKEELDAKFTKKGGALLLTVKSGITGLWQVSGRNDLSTEQRKQLELYYVQNWSFWMDIKILFKTLAVVVRRSGAR